LREHHMADADDAKTLRTLKKNTLPVRNTPENIGSQQESRT
jgi:hypothetical protein